MIKKFTEKDIGAYVNDFYLRYKSDPNQIFRFDFSDYEWISNQNLLIITSIFKYLYRCNSNFKIKLFKTDVREINKKQAQIIIQIWEVWKLYEIFDRPERHFANYIENFENSTIKFLKEKFKISSDYNIYNRLGITPFVTFNIINDYKDDDLLETEIEPIFNLNEAIKLELRTENSEHPFAEETLSTIITRELYENFLDHYHSSFFNSKDDMSFMSISVKRKLGRNEYYLGKTFLNKLLREISNEYPKLVIFLKDVIKNSDSSLYQIPIKEITRNLNDKKLNIGEENNLIDEFEKEDQKNKQYIIGKSIEDEELPESYDFFKDNIQYRNDAYIHYSFIDYGIGISKTILDEYLKENKIDHIDIFKRPNDNDLLKFAFRHYTSRFPITDKHGKIDKFIPRGLFDILTIAQRYQGLLIVRSNYGKLVINFKNTQDLEEAIKTFGSPEDFFPGTYITMYIPELPPEINFDKSVIRYEVKFQKKKGKPKNINLFTLLGSEFVSKESLYTNLITKLKEELTNDTEFSRVNYISFFGVTDRRIITKAIYYLLTDYEINSNNVVLVMHPPKKNDGNEDYLVSELKNQIKALNSAVKNFKIHPLPLVYFDPLKDDVWVEWLGVYNEDDKVKLSDLLFEEYSLSLSDFSEPYNVKGNLISTDKFGNVKGSMPNRSILCQYYQKYTENLVKETINKHNALKSNGLYLCSGNYYQNQFLQMSELLDNRAYRDVLASALFQQILNKLVKKEQIEEAKVAAYLFDSIKNPLTSKKRKLKFIAVTSSSHKIIKSFYEQGYIYKLKANEKQNNSPYINFDNYLEIESDEKLDLIEDDTDFVIVCDAISTGNLVKRLEKIILKQNNSELLYVATFADNLDTSFEETQYFIQKYESKLISLYHLPIKKVRANNLTISDFTKTLIRINPFTNLPIEFKEADTLMNTILFNENNEFLKFVENEDINIRFEIHNNLIHPFYFNIGSILEKDNSKILKDELSESIIYNLLIDKKTINLANGSYAIFYPKESGIEYIDKRVFNSKIAANHTVQFYELQRFASDSGWKFPHSSEYFKEVIENTQNALILDDGTCTGDSLYQIINEISYFEPNRIDLLCIVSRIDDYKREFLSKLKSLKKHTSKGNDIELNIFFGTQWHIPTFYLNNNPYSEEIKWLEAILSIKNTPQFIRKNASKILDIISPSKEKVDDYKYFPREKESGEIPKKDILLTRNEIGKIAGYRFYTENFRWYNQLTFNKYRNDFFDKDLNKSIELLAMCLLYEPYLFGIISKSFPDIRAILELFVENLFFAKDGRKINLTQDLFYDWSNSKKDLIHLFFIVYKDVTLYEFLKKHDNILASFLDFAGDNERALDYILYKLSFYFTYNDHTNAKTRAKIKSLIHIRMLTFESNIDQSSIFLGKIKQFIHFTLTLKTEEKWEDLLSYIRKMYDNIRPKKEEFHDDNLNADKQVIVNLLIEIQSPFLDSDEIQSTVKYINIIYEKNIKVFIQKVLSLADTYPKYFIDPKHLNQIQLNDNSLRALDKLYNDNIHNFLPSKSSVIIEVLDSLYNNFIDKKSFLKNIIFDIITENPVSIISKIRNDVDEKLKEINLGQIRESVFLSDSKINLLFNSNYFELSLKEIFNNLRHSDGKIKLSLSESETHFMILIINGITKDRNKTQSGNGKGTQILSNIKSNDVLESDYFSQVRLGCYIQILKFKKINNDKY